MIDFEKCKKEFDDYTSKFDMNNSMINRKYYHTYRVVDYAEQIGKAEDLNEYDLNLTKVCALLHDIGRFKQAVEYGTFQDSMSIDHGNLGYKLLLENDYISKYLDNEEDKNICLKVVENHNKYKIEEGLSIKERYFTEIIRDSDKIDIMNTQKNVVEDGKREIMPEVLYSLKNKKLYHKDKEIGIRNNVPTIVLQLCFIFDLNFEESFKIIKEKEIIKRKLDILKKNCDSEIVKEIEEIIISYINNDKTLSRKNRGAYGDFN